MRAASKGVGKCRRRARRAKKNAEAPVVAISNTPVVAKTILLSGACGSGKTTILRLGYRELFPHFGRTATLDTDWFFMLVDPHWELPYEERDGALMFRQCAILAGSFFDAGFETVLIGGNALHTRDGEFDDLIDALRSWGDVFHFTLDPTLDEIIRRVQARGGDKTDEWLTTHVAWMREKYASWTSVIDNSAVSPRETASLIAHRAALGEGLLAPAG